MDPPHTSLAAKCLPFFIFASLRQSTQVYSSQATYRRPNIVFILADDLGRADVSFTEGNLQTPTPNIDKLAWDGIILNRHYSQATCTPSRAALMTAKYPFENGMQFPISEGEPWGLPLKFKLLPAHLKDLGYQTYALGKWHLGQHKRQYFPTKRGFDYHFGFLSGGDNFFNYSCGWWEPEARDGRDLYENEKSVPPNVMNNHYLPDLLVEKAEQIIYKADVSKKPLFLYFATPLPRASSRGFGKEALYTMPQYLQRPPIKLVNATFPDRRKELAAIQALDDHVKRITDALRNKGILDNTIIVFASDNGAPDTSHLYFPVPNQRGINHGSNWPMRHSKASFFEGGVRSPAFVWSPLLRKRGLVSEQLFHLIDWLPTLYEAAGGDTRTLGQISGLSQWKSLQAGNPALGPRKDLVVEITDSKYAMIKSHGGFLLKIVSGAVGGKKFWGWTRTEGTSPQNEMKTFTPASAKCQTKPPGKEITPCIPWQKPCLFDLNGDPCETNNIAMIWPDMVKTLQDRIKVLNATYLPLEYKPYDPASHPDKWNGWWVPWLDENPQLIPVPYLAFNPGSTF